MVSEYLRVLEKEHKYIGNWQPNARLEIGDYINYEESFVPWLKNVMGISHKYEEINSNLHNFKYDQIKTINTKSQPKGPVKIAHNTSIAMSGENIIKISSKKERGFLMILENVSDKIAVRESLIEETKHLNNNIAVVSSVTCARSGIIILFENKSSSISLSINPDLIPRSLSAGDMIIENLLKKGFDFGISEQSEGVTIYRAEKRRPLYPFIRLYIPNGNSLFPPNYLAHSESSGRNQDRRFVAYRKGGAVSNTTMSYMGYMGGDDLISSLSNLDDEYDFTEFSYINYAEQYENMIVQCNSASASV